MFSAYGFQRDYPCLLRGKISYSRTYIRMYESVYATPIRCPLLYMCMVGVHFFPKEKEQDENSRGPNFTDGEIVRLSLDGKFGGDEP